MQVPFGAVVPLGTPGPIPARPPFRQKRFGGSGNRFVSWWAGCGHAYQGHRQDANQLLPLVEDDFRGSFIPLCGRSD